MYPKSIIKPILLAAAALVTVPAAQANGDLTSRQLLGKALFFDPALSEPAGQACAACHSPTSGWSGPDSDINRHGAVYEGAVTGRFGNRKPPSAAYAPYSPVLSHSEDTGGFVGGNFWDGRATGEKLGNPAADQAQGPFLNPLEQNLASPKELCAKILASGFAESELDISYEELFLRAYGTGSLDCANDVQGTFDRIALAIAAFEASPEVSAFSSKFDAYLAGRAKLNKQEKWGLSLFEGKAKCAQCHVSTVSPDGKPPLLTDNTYDNAGVPANPENPFYRMPAPFNPLGPDWLDRGLQGFVETRPDYSQYANESAGKQRVPTLRNVDQRPNASFVRAYMHNGVFKDLKTVVHFYNTRDVLPNCGTVSAPQVGENCWPAPEIAANVNDAEMGNLGLSGEEEDAIVAFLKTLTDGYRPRRCRHHD
ncbi:MAG: cytochrome C [Methylococcaceae bacterium]|nr:cytochrome C [Methylococcaceae bacterium]